MEEKNYTGIIPDHHTGKIIDTEETVELNSSEEARAFFQTVKSRLLQVNGWHQLAGALSATFQLVDPNGQEVNREVQQGDYFKIDIPGPGPSAGDGYDWVKVEEVQQVAEGEVESVGIRVRPAPSPLNQDKNVAHFYSPESTSNFTVTREGKKITVGIYDRNTKPNTEVDSVTDKLRDTTVGAGAVAAFSKVQWKNLATGLLKNP